MQKNTVILCLMVWVFLSACGKKSTDRKTVTIPITFSKTKVLTTAIPAMPWSIEIPITDTFATKVDEYLSLYAPGVSRADIVSIKPKSFSVYIDNSTAQNFDFVDDSIKVFVDKYGGSDSILVSKKYGVPLSTKSITFDVVEKDIKDLFYSDYMKFILLFNSRPNQGMMANSSFVTNVGFEIVAYEPE